MTNVIAFLQNVPTWEKAIADVLAIIFMIAAALLMMSGDKGAAKSKPWLGYIFVGIGIVFLAPQIVSTIQGAAGGCILPVLPGLIGGLPS